MSPLADTPCWRCHGACCESLLLPGSLQVEEEWAQARGIRRVTLQTYSGPEEALEAPCPCPKLSPLGSCSIYETRPKLCQIYPVGGPACRSAIARRRSLDASAYILEVMPKEIL